MVRQLVGETAGTALLLAAVVGSGIMAERLSGGNAAVALLANSLATGGVLAALILSLGPVSGAHFNPLVTTFEALHGRSPWSAVPVYVLGQVVGAVVGVVLANLMFALPAVTMSQHPRTGVAQWLSESVATFGLLVVIAGRSRQPLEGTALAVGGYIVGAYWFTASTSFANPAVTMARALTDTFAGIRPVDVPPFILAQLAGGTAAAGVSRLLFPAVIRMKAETTDV